MKSNGHPVIRIERMMIGRQGTNFEKNSFQTSVSACRCGDVRHNSPCASGFGELTRRSRGDSVNTGEFRNNRRTRHAAVSSGETMHRAGCRVFSHRIIRTANGGSCAG